MPHSGNAADEITTEAYLGYAATSGYKWQRLVKRRRHSEYAIVVRSASSDWRESSRVC